MILVRQSDDGPGLLHVMYQECSNRDLPLALPRVTDQLLPTMTGIFLSLFIYVSLAVSVSLTLSLSLSLCPALSGKSADIVSGDWTI